MGSLEVAIHVQRPSYSRGFDPFRTCKSFSLMAAAAVTSEWVSLERPRTKELISIGAVAGQRYRATPRFRLSGSLALEKKKTGAAAQNYLLWQQISRKYPIQNAAISILPSCISSSQKSSSVSDVKASASPTSTCTGSSSPTSKETVRHSTPDDLVPQELKFRHDQQVLHAQKKRGTEWTL